MHYILRDWVGWRGWWMQAPDASPGDFLTRTHRAPDRAAFLRLKYTSRHDGRPPPAVKKACVLCSQVPLGAGWLWMRITMVMDLTRLRDRPCELDNGFSEM